MARASGGDSLEAPVQLVERGPIDYLTLDYLAEITMSIMQKQKSRDQRAGYARDFIDVVGRVLPEVVLRVGVRSGNKAMVERFVKELAPLGLNGPPTVCGLGAGRPKVEEVVAYWPALIPKSAAAPTVQVTTA
jgi:hypothetical protein